MNKKFELTTDTKIVFGRTLYRIKALISFGYVDKGDLGGWVEKESNISASGDAWVSGDARVSGNARVFGNAEKTPIHIQGLYYPITITDKHIRIGCEFHLTDKWESFTDREILELDGKSAAKFWNENKSIIIQLANNHQPVTK